MASPAADTGALAARSGEAARADAAGLRTGIRVVDDRILLRRIQIGRHEQLAVDVGLAVGGLYTERDGWLPAGCKQSRNVGFLEWHDDFAAHGVAQHDDLVGEFLDAFPSVHG